MNLELGTHRGCNQCGGYSLQRNHEWSYNHLKSQVASHEWGQMHTMTEAKLISLHHKSQ